MSNDSDANAGNIANRFAALSVTDAGWDDVPPKRNWADMSDEEDDVDAPVSAPAPAASVAANTASSSTKPTVRFAKPTTGRPSGDDFQTVTRERRQQRGGASGGRPRFGDRGNNRDRRDGNRGDRDGTRGNNRDRRDPASHVDNYEICSFNKLCPNPNCPKIHHKDRDINKVIIDPNREYCIFALNGAECKFKDCSMAHDIVCPYAAECTIGGCILQHPEGHDPATVECRRALDCQNSKCVGKHPEGRELPVCDFDPFCTRVGTTCNKRHTALNGKLRMVRGFCNYKVNMMACRHDQPCSYEDPGEFVCRDGVRCVHNTQKKCGFMHKK